MQIGSTGLFVLVRPRAKTKNMMILLIVIRRHSGNREVEESIC